MPRYADDAKERVRDAVDMVDLVGTKTDLRRAGANRYEGLCPFHEERTPSFGIDPVKKLFHCFGCQAGGDIFDFVMQTDGLEFTGALETLAARYGIELEVVDEDPRAAERRARRERLLGLLERTANFYARTFWEGAEAADARAYMLGRGLDEQTLRDFRVGYAPSAWDTVTVASRRAGFSEEELLAGGVAVRSKKGQTGIYDRFRRRIMFPLADARGKVLGFGGRALGEDQMPKYLNSSENEVFHKGRQLFGVDRARASAAKAGAAILAEGYTDVLALHQAGLENAVGIMGTALTEEQVGELARLAGANGRLELALDADAAGQGAMLRAARIVAGRNLQLRVVPLEDGADPADLVVREGADAMRSRVARSVPFVRFQVERILEAVEPGSAESADGALAELRDVLGSVPPSPTRSELERMVASRLGLSEQLVASLTAERSATGQRQQSFPVRARPSSPAPAAGGRVAVVLDRRAQIERTFLALCVALGDEGGRVLSAIDPERLLTSPLTRRAAAHLRDHLAAPLEGIANDDRDLRDLMVELTVRAEREPASAVAVEVERLQLELEALDRDLASAARQPDSRMNDLAGERNKVRAQLGDAISKAADVGGKA